MELENIEDKKKLEKKPALGRGLAALLGGEKDSIPDLKLCTLIKFSYKLVHARILNLNFFFNLIFLKKGKRYD